MKNRCKKNLVLALKKINKHKILKQTKNRPKIHKKLLKMKRKHLNKLNKIVKKKLLLVNRITQK